MAIVKYKNQSGRIYAYESTSYWDPDKKQSRPVRKYLGRVDPETGEIISTKGKRGRPKKLENVQAAAASENPDYKALYRQCCSELKETQKALASLEQDNSRLISLNRQLKEALLSILREAGDCIKSIR